MKKIFAVLAMAVVLFASCGRQKAADVEAEAAADSTEVVADTLAADTVAVDSVAVAE